MAQRKEILLKYITTLRSGGYCTFLFTEFYRVYLGSAPRYKDPMGAVQYDAPSLVNTADRFGVFLNITAFFQVFWSFHKISINILQIFHKFNQLLYSNIKSPE